MSILIAVILGILIFHIGQPLWQRMEFSHQLIILLLVIVMLFSVISSLFGEQLPAMNDRLAYGISAVSVVFYIFNLMRCQK